MSIVCIHVTDSIAFRPTEPGRSTACCRCGRALAGLFGPPPCDEACDGPECNRESAVDEGDQREAPVPGYEDVNADVDRDDAEVGLNKPSHFCVCMQFYAASQTGRSKSMIDPKGSGIQS
jgi:hypothetical protein